MSASVGWPNTRSDGAACESGCLFPTVPEAGKSTTKGPAWLGSGKDPFHVPRWHLPSGSSPGPRELCGSLLSKALISLMRAPPTAYAISVGGQDFQPEDSTPRVCKALAHGEPQCSASPELPRRPLRLSVGTAVARVSGRNGHHFRASCA